MKNLFSTLSLLVMFAFLLSGCDQTHEPLSQHVKDVVDLGARPLPNSAAQLHGYRVINPGTEEDHFVYLIERNGQPVGGAATNRVYRSGKTNHLSSVTSVVTDSGTSDAAQAPSEPDDGPVIQVKCADEAQCVRIAAAIKAVR